MSDTTKGARAFRVRARILPAIMIGGTFAATLIVATDLAGRPIGYAPFEPAALTDISLTASVDQSEVVAYRSVLTESCDRTGCDADLLHPMILASSGMMTAEELTDAMDAQKRVMKQGEAIRSGASDPEEARMAELEILAAERLGLLYDAELARR